MNLTVVFRELWQSWRASLRRPGFVLLAGLTLALGLGLSVAMFALVNTLVLAPLPFAQPNRLVSIGKGPELIVPARWYGALHDLPALQSVSYMTGTSAANMASPGKPPAPVTTLGVGQSYLPTLGVRLALGRNFSASEMLRNGPRAVILTYGFWRQRYASRDAVLGSMLQLDGHSYAIIGVLPKNYRWIVPFDLLVPANLHQAIEQKWDLSVFARLHAHVGVRQAGVQINERLQHWLQAHGESQPEPAHLETMLLAANWTINDIGIFGIIMICTLAVLLLAAVNVTNLMLQRAVLRGHVHAIRNALGASLPRMALPMLGEGLLIAVLGITMALGIAQLALLWANATLMRPEWFAFVPGVHLTPGVFVLSATAGLLVMLAASLLALWRARSSQAVRELVGGGRSGQTVGASRLSRVLVVLQAALGMTLLMVALLFARSQQVLAQAKLGIDADHVISTTITPPASLYPDAQTLNTLARQVIARMRAIPGVRRVGVLNTSPIGSYTQIRLHSDNPKPVAVSYQFVAGDVLQALGVALQRGRVFDDTDHMGSAPVALVNKAFVRAHLRGDPLGQQVTLDLRGYGLPDESVTVVGVLGDIKTFGLAYPTLPTLYVPMAQVPPKLLLSLINRLHFEAAVSGSPITYAAAMRQAVHAVAPQLAVQHARPLSERMRNFFAPIRVIAEIMGALAAVALLLASLGLYAVVSVGTQARRREWGVRGALGADPTRLILHVLRQGMRLVAIGVGFGLALGWAATRTVQHLLTSTVAHVDAQAAAVAALALALLLSAALLACLAPALRAAHTPPVAALSDD
ncbi:MAG: ABC transporter permease [Metallibacterium sp.]